MSPRSRLALTLVAFVLFVAGGCRAADARDVVELRFWAMGAEGEAVQQMIPEFERTHPGIRVRVQQMPWTLPCRIISASDTPSSAVLIAPASVTNITPPRSRWRVHASAASLTVAALKCR